jgi:hypothetical protein
MVRASRSQWDGGDVSLTAKFGNLGSATTDITAKVRLPGGKAVPWTLVEAAEKGSPASSGFAVEDTASAVTLTGLKEVHFEDSVSVDPTIFAGFFDTRNVSRAIDRALMVGVQREWDASVTDLNTLLVDYIITSGIRPAETDIARIDWLLASGYLPLGEAGFIDDATTTNLPAADYTGRMSADVLAECSNLSGQNYFVRWEQACTFADPASPWAAPFVSSYVAPAAYPIASSPDTLGGKYGQWGVGGWTYLPAGSIYSCSAVGNTQGSPNNGSQFGVSAFAAMGPVSVLASYKFDLLAAGLPAIATVGLIGWITTQPPVSGGTRPFTLLVEASNDGTTWSTVFDTAAIDPTNAHGGTFIGTVPLALTQRRYWRVTFATGWTSGAQYCNFGILGIMLWSGSAIGPGPALGYHAYNWSSDASTLAISNVLSEIDNVTTFGPGQGDKLSRNPARVFSDLWFEYSGGHLTASNATTRTNFRPRWTRSADMNCTNPTDAAALAAAYLTRCATEEDRFTATLDNVPASVVNGARPGQRIGLKLSHEPGYTSGAYMGIMRRNVTPLVGGLYRLVLELANPVLTGFRPAQSLSPSLWQNIAAVVAPTTSPTTALHGQRVEPTFIAYGDGSTVLFTLSTGYIPGSLLLWVDAQPIPTSAITETSPSAGTFTLNFAPAAASSSAPAESLTASWQVP